MISKSKMAMIISLQKKKAREEEKLYVIEGDKLIKEYLMANEPVKMLIARPEFLNSIPSAHKSGINEIIPASNDELKKISSLKTPHNALAVIKMPDNKVEYNNLDEGLKVALDFVQDPGNLGTIIRAAAWFGMREIYCSDNCVDVYNPKVIQATMGAILHVKVFYTDLQELFLKASAKKIRIYGAMLEGESIYSRNLGKTGIIFLGNESKGISENLLPFITDRIMIPKLTGPKPGIDSLNVGMAASVIFSEFTRIQCRHY